MVRYRKVGNTKWLTDTVNTNLDTLKTLNANTSYEWQVATICQYPLIIISSYTAGTNFTTPLSPNDIFTSNTSDYKEATAGDGFSAMVYPNPATTSADLKVKNPKGPYSVIVTSLEGAVLWRADDVTDSDVKISLTGFAQGAYLVTVYDKTHKGILKLIKQ